MKSATGHLRKSAFLYEELLDADQEAVWTRDVPPAAETRRLEAAVSIAKRIIVHGATNVELILPAAVVR